ncbi:MAG: 3-isopropylmalate dehydrogenase [Eubacteriales bacterium]|nr:3-isopropylmalate dehydrogenase [Eubacteriales bacterium]NCC80729.1 3-isopropylmalate dehydrogenase [Clostridia bacterium]
MYKIAVLPGDGIGKEIVDSALKVLYKVSEKYKLDMSFEEAYFGGAGIDKYGKPFPDETWEIVQRSDAILLGSVGGPKWDKVERTLRPETGLLEIRKRLGLYCNVRPVKYFPVLADMVAWKPEYLEGVDLIILRELTGGAYFGKKGREGDEAFDTISYSKEEIKRIVVEAFEMAMKRKKLIHSIDKANVLETSRLWREVVEEVAFNYPEVKVEHLYVDNASIQLIINPKQFDVIVTENMFGDILSDEAASIAGSLGMLPSASLGGKINLYEPAHGSAPDIAGQDKANPIATILSAAMMLRSSFNEDDIATKIEQAVENVLAKGYATGDIAGKDSIKVGTEEFTKLVCEEI